MRANESPVTIVPTAADPGPVRAVARVDDEMRDVDREWVHAYHPAPALLHHIDPRYGLTEADYAILAEWAHKAA